MDSGGCDDEECGVPVTENLAAHNRRDQPLLKRLKRHPAECREKHA